MKARMGHLTMTITRTNLRQVGRRRVISKLLKENIAEQM